MASEAGTIALQNVTLSVQALDPKSTSFPNLASAYPDQGPVSQPPANSSEFQVKAAPPDGLGAAHRVEVHGLNVLAAENAIAAVQVERNLITLDRIGRHALSSGAGIRLHDGRGSAEPAGDALHRQRDAARLTPQRRFARPCPVHRPSLCQHVLTVMTDLLADPVQSASLLKAHQAAGVTTGTTRRVKVGCSYQFPDSRGRRRQPTPLSTRWSR